MNPPADSQGPTLEQVGAYLRLLARLQSVDDRLQAKLDLSGVVQEAWLKVSEHLDRLQEMSEGERAKWLRTVFLNRLADAIRKCKSQGRDAHRDRSLEAALDESSAHVAAQLAADQSSPSVHAIANEQSLRLAAALEQLPADQRLAVELKYFKGLRLAELAQHLNRSTPAAAAQVLSRALKRLRGLLKEDVRE